MLKSAHLVLPFTLAAFAWVLGIALGAQTRDALAWFALHPRGSLASSAGRSRANPQDRHRCAPGPQSTFGVQIFARQDGFPGYNVPTGRLIPAPACRNGGPVSPASVYRSLCGFASPRARACSPAPCRRMPVAVSPLSIKLFSSCAVEHSKPRPVTPMFGAAAIAGKTGFGPFAP